MSHTPKAQKKRKAQSEAVVELQCDRFQRKRRSRGLGAGGNDSLLHGGNVLGHFGELTKCNKVPSAVGTALHFPFSMVASGIRVHIQLPLHVHVDDVVVLRVAANGPGLLCGLCRKFVFRRQHGCSFCPLCGAIHAWSCIVRLAGRLGLTLSPSPVCPRSGSARVGTDTQQHVLCV